jgi:hypothetical protein
MAGIAVAWLMAHGANLVMLIGKVSVILREQHGMDKSLDREIFIPLIMTVKAKPQVFSRFLNVFCRRDPIYGCTGAGQDDRPQCNKTGYY